MSIHSASEKSAAVVAVDVGKSTVALSVTGAGRQRLFGPVDFVMTGPGLSDVLDRVRGVLPPGAAVKVGGRLVAEHFADPDRLATLGPSRFIRFAKTRGLRVRQPVAERVVDAARNALRQAPLLARFCLTSRRRHGRRRFWQC